jgi:hypothetical protein
MTFASQIVAIGLDNNFPRHPLKTCGVIDHEPDWLVARDVKDFVSPLKISGLRLALIIIADRNGAIRSKRNRALVEKGNFGCHRPTLCVR